MFAASIDGLQCTVSYCTVFSLYVCTISICFETVLLHMACVALPHFTHRGHLHLHTVESCIHYVRSCWSPHAAIAVHGITPKQGINFGTPCGAMPWRHAVRRFWWIIPVSTNLPHTVSLAPRMRLLLLLGGYHAVLSNRQFVYKSDDWQHSLLPALNLPHTRMHWNDASCETCVAVKGEGKLKENRAKDQMCVEMSDGTMLNG